MRQLTAYASYLDNLGAPLVGRARFFNMDGSEAVVYSLDNATNLYVQIGSSVFTNSSGQLVPQVFLDNHDYIVVFDKYVGAGTMAEDDDPESWAEQGSAVDRYNTLGVVLDGDSVRSINTVAELKVTQAIDIAGGEIVMLLGYNVQGDKPVIFYRWNASSTKVDNGGSVIKVNDVSVGRWELVECPEYLDVRHFGAFPLEASVVDPMQRYAIQQAGKFAHDNNCGLYFPASDTAIYYDITGLTLHDVDSNPAARVFGKTPEPGDDPLNTKATIHDIVSIHCGGSTHGLIELVAPTVRSSWEGDYGYAILSPTETLVIDSMLRTGNRTWTGIKVQMETYGGPYMVFDDCLITSNGAITGGITIKNCELHSDWFSDSYLWSNLISIGNAILLWNCDSADTYIKIKNRQLEVNYGDLGEQELHGAQLADGALVENCSGTVTLAGSADIRNASLTITASSSPSNLNCTDAWLTFDTATFNNVSINRGSLAGNQLNTIGTTILQDVDIEMPLNVLGGRLVCRSCRIDANISHVGSPVVEEFIGNIFNATLNIRGGSVGAVVNATWTNNHGNVANPIVIDRTNFDTVDSNHTYVYKNNSGTMEMTATVNILIYNTTGYQPGTPNTVYCLTSGGLAYNLWGLTEYENDGGGNYVENPNKYVCKIKLFTIGTTAIRKTIRIVPQGQFIENAGGAGSISIGSADVLANTWDGMPAGSGNYVSTLLFDSGFEWKLRHFVVPCPGGSLASGTYTKIFRIEQIQ